jgi:acyl-CoA synthetase (AMP-forming)/AMP-acid ligase II
MNRLSPMYDPPVLLRRISDYASHYASTTPHAEAAVCGDIRLSYRDLSDQVEAVAKALIASGVGLGDRVATLSPPHPDFLVMFLASVSIGAIWLGLDPRYQIEELKYIVGDARPVLLFSRADVNGRQFTSELKALQSEFPQLRIVLSDARGTPATGESFGDFVFRGHLITPGELSRAQNTVCEQGPALIIYTSGTTGKPKGAVLTHRGLVRCSRVQASLIRPEPLRMINNLPISHLGCVGDISCYTLVSGGTIVFMEKFDPRGTLETIQKEGITLWGQLPTMFQLCLSLEDFANFDLSCIRTIFWSGAAAPVPLILRLKQICPTLCCSYGLTETTGSVTFAVGTDDLDVLANSVGWAVEEYEVRIADPDGHEVGTGEAGEIQVRGDFIMKGYWNRPEATAETIDAAGWLHTGDVGRWRPDGTLQLVGRIKEMFKSGGYNVYPREIEPVIEAYAGVAMCAVIGVPDNVYGEVGHAYVLVDDESSVTAEGLREHCRRHLANYKVPKAFFVSMSLPMLPNGKIDKTSLRKMAVRSS